MTAASSVNRRIRGHRAIVSAPRTRIAATGTVVCAGDPQPTPQFVRGQATDSHDWFHRPFVTRAGSPGVAQTGYFRVLTAAAVTNFQRANRLPATGQVGSATWAKLTRVVSAASTTGSQPVLRLPIYRSGRY